MKRITEKVEGYICINPEDNDCPTMSFCQFCDIPVNRCKYFEDTIEKLAKYEDLEERCIKETTWSLRMLLDKWHVFSEELVGFVEYRELKKEGLVHIAPLKDGTTIYFIEEDWVFDGIERYITKTSYLHVSTNNLC